MPIDDNVFDNQKTREAFIALYKECRAQDQKEGYVDPIARETLAKMNTSMVEQFDKVHGRLDKQDDTVRQALEKTSRPPGSGFPVITAPPSVAKSFIESDGFKSANWNGRINVSATVKARIRPDAAKAVSTITEGGIITITPPAGAYPIFPYRVGLIPQRFARTVMRDLVPVVPLDGTNAIEYVKETWTSGADYQVLEGDKKAQSGVTYTEFTAPVRTIAHYVKVSRQMASDVPFIMTAIEGKLSFFVLFKEDHEILYGDNSAGHLWGIMPQAIPATTYGPATPPAGITSIDQINAALTYVENQFYSPSAIVLNPTDEAKLEMVKTTLGSYVLGDRAPREDGVVRLWGLPIVTTPAMNQGDFLVGDFANGCALFDRETVTVEIAFQNEDDFVRNLVTIRAEERVAFAVFVAGAFAKGPFNTPPGNSGAGPYLLQDETGASPAPAQTQHKSK